MLKQTHISKAYFLKSKCFTFIEYNFNLIHKNLIIFVICLILNYYICLSVVIKVGGAQREEETPFLFTVRLCVLFYLNDQSLEHTFDGIGH